MLTSRITEVENQNLKSRLWWSVSVLVGLLTLTSLTLDLMVLVVF